MLSRPLGEYSCGYCQKQRYKFQSIVRYGIECHVISNQRPNVLNLFS